jgi:hypothetical protein
MKTEIQEKLETLARKRTIPFCSNDYIECPKGRCPKCFSDDLMTLHPRHGLDWGIESAIREIVAEELTPVDSDGIFAELICDTYPETTTIGYMTYDTVTALRILDPVAWDIGRSENMDSLELDDQIMSFDGGCTYFWIHDLESLFERG